MVTYPPDPLPLVIREGKGELIKRGGDAPSLFFLPPPLSREGDKGGGSPNKNRNFTPETI
jgi:hypothetical protein